MRCSVELYHDVAPQVYGDTAFNTKSTLSASVSIHLSDLHLRLTLLSPPIHLSETKWELLRFFNETARDWESRRSGRTLHSIKGFRQ